MSSSSPIYRLLLVLGIIFILYCNCYCNAFVPPPTSSSTKSLLQKQQFDTPSPILSTASTTLLKVLPLDEILTSTTTNSVVSSLSSYHLSSFLQSSSTLLSTTATDIIASTDDNNILSTLLRTPTLWSVLAMTSIVALLVAWEEAIE